MGKIIQKQKSGNGSVNCQIGGNVIVYQNKSSVDDIRYSIDFFSQKTTDKYIFDILRSLFNDVNQSKQDLLKCLVKKSEEFRLAGQYMESYQLIKVAGTIDPNNISPEIYSEIRLALSKILCRMGAHNEAVENVKIACKCLKNCKDVSIERKLYYLIVYFNILGESGRFFELKKDLKKKFNL